MEELDQRYLIAEVMRPAPGLEDRLYWEILRKSNKSVIEKIRELENSQREYKEYIESWIHEVKTPITAAHLICENHKDGYTRQIMTELNEMGMKWKRSCTMQEWNGWTGTISSGPSVSAASSCPPSGVKNGI